MFLEVLKNLSAMLYTVALGSALVGLFVWVLAAQGAADRRIAFVFWGLAVILIILGIVR